MKKTHKAAILSVALACAHPFALADKPKVGFVYVGPVGDHGWTYQHHAGRDALEQAGYETSYVESVPEGADAERVIRQLASTGHDLIFTTSFGYMDPTNKIAQAFPDVKFEHATGYKRESDNVSSYNIRFYEGRYVTGKMAGELTKSNKLGYVGAFPIPEVVRGINAAILGARSVNPDAEIHVVWVNSWFDPGKEADAAKTLIDQGVDVIMQHTDSAAPMQTAEQRGVWAIGQASDMHEFGPNAQVSAIVNSWGPYYLERAKAVENGTWKQNDVWGGFSSDMLRMGQYGEKVPAGVVKMAEDTVEMIKSGAIHPFDGPIKDQSGTVQIPAGQHADDGLLLGMDWYVEGVVGQLPQ
ncbi:MAG: BMP family ABC transporter substrate-binding protein [Betaproteobacteria bacterium AqS2]|uniref:BMP family ABC transporter substrate-binding protein n=1 Tax=Candidatus Amphirhobacter heronislandensis TaxID=1732024 RepID=A0A930Y2G8_9GAMM|nr:BMP family ABC transporter substrate-binding protein [Betaproteobacteria bacterium AqS2]